MDASRLDEDMIARMGAGNAEAFRDFYRATSDAVFGFALSIVGNRMDAEDVMHDAFIRAYQGAAMYRPQGKPLAWLLTIVRNTSYNKLKARKTTVDIRDFEGTLDAPVAGDPLDRIVLEKAMAILDDQERQVVVLHAVTGLKHREIAEILEMPQGTVLSKYHRALGKLKAEIEGEEALR